MRQLLCYAVAASMVFLACAANGATTPANPPAQKTYTKKSAVTRTKTAPHATATTTRKAAPSTAAKGGTSARKGTTRRAPVKQTTWRNRQLAPTPDRYKEIQNGLVAKGFLQPEDAGGAWNQTSVDALKKFQAAQNLEPSGKINSLSLIALGLGPKHDPAPVKPAEAPQ